MSQGLIPHKSPTFLQDPLSTIEDTIRYHVPGRKSSSTSVLYIRKINKEKVLRKSDNFPKASKSSTKTRKSDKNDKNHRTCPKKKKLQQK